MTTIDYLNEAAYRGNLGLMELIKFMEKATPKQKEMFQEYVSSNELDKILKLIQLVTGTRLYGSKKSKPKNLMVFDFDNTLITSDAKAVVIHTDGTTSVLDPFEYAKYKKRDGDKFDFSQFDTVKGAHEIQKYIRLLKAGIADPNTDVVVVTARGNSEVVARYFKSIGIERGVKIKAIGSSDPREKLLYIKSKLDGGTYEDLLFYDDSPDNTSTVRKIKKYFPQLNVRVHAHTVPTSEYRPHVPIDQERVGRALMEKIPNPETENWILVKTALGYGRDHPAYKIARRYLARVIRKKD